MIFQRNNIIERMVIKNCCKSFTFCEVPVSVKVLRHQLIIWKRAWICVVDERVRAKDLQKYLLFCKQVEGGGGGAWSRSVVFEARIKIIDKIRHSFSCLCYQIRYRYSLGN